ncbi:hypothetical protein GCM10027402_15090 [Arthrobacter monumenti]
MAGFDEAAAFNDGEFGGVIGREGLRHLLLSLAVGIGPEYRALRDKFGTSPQQVRN